MPHRLIGLSPTTMHPCLSCGACCAHYRVSLHWSEAEPSLGGVTPVALTEPCGPHQLAMRGTWQALPHCVALVGAVGVAVTCGIYEQRPSPCRELQAAWEHGAPNAQCDRARAAYGLAALTPADWLALTAAAPAQETTLCSQGVEAITCAAHA